MSIRKGITGSIIIFLSAAIISAMVFFASLSLGATAYATNTDVWDGTVDSGFAGGSGTQADPYFVATCSQLAYLVQEVNGGDDFYGKYVVLDDNVVFDLNGLTWSPIGYLYIDPNTSVVTARPFRGHFTGATINNLSLDNTFQTPGLFGLIGVDGTVTDVALNNVSIVGATAISGGIAAVNEGTVSSCSVRGTIGVTGAADSDCAGAVVGFNVGEITSCSVGGAVTISGFATIGGLVGTNDNDESSYWDHRSVSGGGTYALSDCSVDSLTSFTLTAALNGDDLSGAVGSAVGSNRSSVEKLIFASDTTSLLSAQTVGGVVGQNSGDVDFTAFCGAVTVRNAEVLGGVSGNNGGSISNAVFTPSSLVFPLTPVGKVGGITGDVGSDATVTGSYAKASLAGSYVGGIASDNYGAISDCFFVGSVSGERAGGAVDYNGGSIGRVLIVGRNGALFGVNGVSYSGGVAACSSSTATINNSFVIANVNKTVRNGTSYYGGVKGDELGVVTSTYYLKEIALDNVGSGISNNEMFGTLTGLDGTYWAQSSGYAPLLKYFSAYSGAAYAGITDLYASAVSIPFNSASRYEADLDGVTYYVPDGYSFILPEAVRTGYTFANWTDGNDNYDACEYVYDDDKDMAFTSVFTLDDIVLVSVTGDVDKTYDGNGENIGATFSHALAMTYQWYYSADGTAFVALVGAESGLYTVSYVSQSGYYYLVATVSDNGNTTTYDTRGGTDDYFSVAISKADFNNVAHDPFNGVYSPSHHLADFVLDTYYSWVDPTLTPTVPVTSYSAVYNSDSANYNDYHLNVTVTLSKANYVGITHEAIDGGKYAGYALSYYSSYLDPYFVWADPSVVPTVAGTVYAAKYNADPNNYNDFDINIAFTLAKGDYNNITHGDFNGVYSPTQRLSDFVLDTDYAWVAPNTVPTANVYYYAATYCADGANYNAYALEVKILLDKADPTVTPSVAAITYYAGDNKPIISLDAGDTAGNINWQDNGVLLIGANSYLWTFIPTDITNYNSASGSLTVTALAVNLTSITVVNNSVTEFVAFSAFDERENIVVTAHYDNGRDVDVNDYSLSYKSGLDHFTRNENGNVVVITYGGMTAEFAVTVNKSVVTEPADEADYYYTGSAQTIMVRTNGLYTVTGNSATAAGNYTATVVLIDFVNCEWKETVGDTCTVSWSIQKAVLSVPEAPEGYYYDGNYKHGDTDVGEHLVVLPGGTVMAKNAGTYSFTVSIDDTDNYSWWGGSVENKVVTWTIAKNQLNYPVAVSRTYTYDGSVLTFEYTADATVGVRNNTDKAISAGDHDVWFFITDTDNYVWTMGGSSDYLLVWHIDKSTVAVPVPAVVDYVYTGSEQTYLYSGGENAVVTNYRATAAGLYTVTFALQNGNYIWSDETSANKTYNWTISPKPIALPIKTGGDFVFDGTYKTFLYSVDTAAVTVGNDIMLHADTYYLSFALKSDNYVWSDTTTSDKTLTYVIAPKPVDIPEPSVNTFTYSENEITMYLGTSAYYTVSGNVRTVVGDYTAYATLNNATYSDYIWSDDTIAPKSYPWSIIKRRISKPDYVSEELEYAESPISPSLSATSDYTVGGNVATAVGVYHAIVSLVDVDNNEWEDGTTSDLVFDWSIIPMPLALPSFGANRTYSGTEIELEITVYDKCGKSRHKYTAAGNYTATVSLPDENYVWNNGSTANISWNWSINPARINRPALIRNSVYSPYGSTAEIIPSELYTITANQAIDAGDYVANVSLVDKDNYEWDNGSDADISINWSIVPAEKELPYLIKNLIYSGSEQTAVIVAPSGCTVSGNVAKDVGSYSATVTLNDDNNYRWSDGTKEPKIVPFAIYALRLSTGEGSEILSYTTGTVLPTPTKANFSFGGWYDNAEFTGAPILTLDGLDADTVLYAKWVDNSSADPATPTNNEDKSKLSTGAIIGIAVAGAGALVALGIILLALTRKPVSRRKDEF